MRGDMAQRYKVTAVERTFQVLEGLSQAREGLGLSELTARLGMVKSTVFGILITLEQLGYVDHNARTDKYKLNFRLFALGARVVEGLNLVQVSSDALYSLMEQSGETANLGVLEQNRGIYLVSIEGPGPIKVAAWAGKPAPLHCSALGKVLLSGMSPERMARVFARERLRRFTERTITDMDQLRAELARVRESGYATEMEEEVIGLGCVAAPVRDHRGHIIAAVSLTAPAHRLAPEMIPAKAAMVLGAALEISRRLGLETAASRPTGNGQPYVDRATRRGGDGTDR